MSKLWIFEAFKSIFQKSFSFKTKIQPGANAGCTRCCAPGAATGHCGWALRPPGQGPESRGGAPPTGAHRRRAPPAGAGGASVFTTLSRTDGKGGMARRHGGSRDRGSVLAGEKGGGHARPSP